MPVLGYQANPFLPPECGNVVNAAQGKAMADVTARAFFSVEIPVVLWDGRFIHRRTEVWRVGQIFGESVVGQKAEPMRIAAADIHEARVVPALRGVFQQIDGADWKSLTLHEGSGAIRRQHRARHKSKRLEGTPRPQRARSGESVVDQVRPLQMETSRADVADFKRGVLPEALLHGAVPLLDVLRGSVGIEGCEAHRGWRQGARAQNGCAEIHPRVEEGRRRSEVIGLL